MQGDKKIRVNISSSKAQQFFKKEKQLNEAVIVTLQQFAIIKSFQEAVLASKWKWAIRLGGKMCTYNLCFQFAISVYPSPAIKQVVFWSWSDWLYQWNGTLYFVLSACLFLYIRAVFFLNSRWQKTFLNKKWLFVNCLTSLLRAGLVNLTKYSVTLLAIMYLSLHYFRHAHTHTQLHKKCMQLKLL